MDDDNESSSSKLVNSSPQQRHPRKLQVYNEILRRIKESDADEAKSPGFDDQLWLHFNRLPVRYALDVKVEKAEDVLTHKRLLSLAEISESQPVFEVRLVQSPVNDGNLVDAAFSDLPNEDDENPAEYSDRQGIQPPATFSSPSNFEDLSHANNDRFEKGESSVNPASRHTYEITFSSKYTPKLHMQLTSLLSEVELNIQEAHGYCTADGFSLEAFVVDSWRYQEIKELEIGLKEKISMMKDTETLGQFSPTSSSVGRYIQTEIVSSPDYVKPSDGSNDWQVDPSQLRRKEKIKSGSLIVLYRGTYHAQEVVIKYFKPEKQYVFSQELYIMRKFRHRNIVQFIGACTQPSQLCIVTEFMSRGNLYDFMHKRNGVFRLPDLIKVAIDVCKGMTYLHHNNIIHRNLKTANLLMNRNGVTNVSGFGRARLRNQSGEMTEVTGTPRWMAPEVNGRKQYDHKIDVYSFGIILWELLTGQLPYSLLLPDQVLPGIEKGLRPSIPKNTLPTLSELIKKCWHQEPSLRPEFSEILKTLMQIALKGEEEKDPMDWFSVMIRSFSSRPH